MPSNKNKKQVTILRSAPHSPRGPWRESCCCVAGWEGMAVPLTERWGQSWLSRQMASFSSSWLVVEPLQAPFAVPPVRFAAKLSGCRPHLPASCTPNCWNWPYCVTLDQRGQVVKIRPFYTCRYLQHPQINHVTLISNEIF